ncbi:hypothetical protein RIF29_40314 [Crotalaria pallida]|uniref:DUF4005 domain-containing protein n=1 Tax=Crotalaria pallida TaxID=3830 RepID=A0AAN9E5X8_CROPI
MGRATRWLRNLFGIKGDKELQQHQEDNNSSSRVVSHNPATIPPANISQAEAAWLQSFYKEVEKEQNKHAIAVAVATAAAADAAKAAAQAAVAMVRLTSPGRGTMFDGGAHEMWAALRIQTLFRGFLARKALRALKGLVKLQALVRGYLVRKQVTATLHSMQAVIRAQATVRYHKSRGCSISTKNDSYRFHNRARRSTERFDDTTSKYATPIYSTRLSSSFDVTVNNNNNNNSVGESPKILEVDTGIVRPKSRYKIANTSISDSRDDPSFHAISSSLSIPCGTPARLTIPGHRNFNDSSEWRLIGEEYRFSSTAHSTPKFTNSCSFGAPVTPKCMCTTSDYLLLKQYGTFPNYMADTQSFKAKSRSHSAPKQRPEPVPLRSRSSLSEVRIQKSCSKVQEAVSFKNAVIGKLHNKSTESAGEFVDIEGKESLMSKDSSTKKVSSPAISCKTTFS